MVDLTDRIIGAESGGNPFLRNPRSSAAGAGQFIDSTWLNTMKRHRPDLATGKSDAELLRMKFDPALSREMTSAYASDNQNFLRSRGIDPNAGNTYLAHFAGPSGAAALHANPQASVEATLGPSVVAANPFLRGKTGADVINWAASKVDPAKSMAASLRQRFGTSTAGGVAPPPQSVSGGGGGVDRLKSALTKAYDPDRIISAENLRDSGQKIAGTSGNALGAIGGSILAGIGGYQRGEEAAAKKAHDAEFAKRAGEAGDTSALMNVMLSSSDPKMREAGLELKAKLLTPKTTEWVPTADGRAVVNKATGETRLTGVDKVVTPTDVERRAAAAGLKPGTPEYSDYVLRGPERSASPTELERRAIAGGLKPGTPEYEKYVLAGPPKTATEKWNENQSKAANFGNMMTQAEAELQAAAGTNPDGTPKTITNPKNIGGAIRDAVVPLESARNAMRPDETQAYEQAANQWIRAKLRKESGAAIGKDEMQKEFETYFPQYWDGPETIARKARARAEATRGMIAESSGAYQHFFGEKAEGDAGDNPDVPRAVKTQTIDPATGQPVPAGAAPIRGQSSGPPAGAIDKLTANPTPEMRQFFDQKYGAGAADRELSRRQSQAPTQDELQQSFGAGLY